MCCTSLLVCDNKFHGSFSDDYLSLSFFTDMVPISEKLFTATDCQTVNAELQTLQVDLDLVKQSLVDPSITVSVSGLCFSNLA